MNIIYITENSENIIKDIIDQLDLFFKYVDITNNEIKKIRSNFKSKEKSYFIIERKEVKSALVKDLPFVFDIEWRILY